MKSSLTRRRVLYLTCVLTVGGWFAFSRTVLPQVIEDAYAMKSHPAINAMIRGRDVRSLEEYQRKGRDRANLVLFVLTFTAAAAVVVNSQWVNQRLQKRWPCTETEARLPASRWRRGVVLITIGLLPAIQAAAAVVQYDCWPFLSNNMFSGLQADTFQKQVITGVSGDGFVPLASVDNALSYGFGSQQMGLKAWIHQPEGRDRIRLALAGMLQEYESRRAAGEHDGPPLSEMRYDTVRYRLDRDDTRQAVSIERILIASSAEAAE